LSFLFPPLEQALLVSTKSSVFLAKFEVVAIIAYLPLQHLLEYLTLGPDFPFFFVSSTSLSLICSFSNTYPS